MLHLSPWSSSLALRPPAATSRCVVANSTYSFASVESKETGRKNKARERRKERGLSDIVDGLCYMTEKQRRAVAHICGEDVLENVRIAASLPRVNQGRKRQENLVAKMLRNQLDDAAVAKLAEAVQLARETNNSFVDMDIQAQIDAWRDGCLQGDQVEMGRVMSLCAEMSLANQGDASGLDDIQGDGSSTSLEGEEEGPAVVVARSSDKVITPQQLRTLIRQCQQAQKELCDALAKAGVQTQQGTGPSDPNAEQLPAVSSEQDAAAKVQVDKARRRNRQLMRQLNAALRPLALRVVGASS